MQQMRDKRDADPGAALTQASLDTLQTVSLLGQAPSAWGKISSNQATIVAIRQTHSEGGRPSFAMRISLALLLPQTSSVPERRKENQNWIFPTTSKRASLPPFSPLPKTALGRYRRLGSLQTPRYSKFSKPLASLVQAQTPDLCPGTLETQS